MGKYCVGDLPCTLEIEVADLIQQVEDYKAANLHLRYRLALALEETKQAYKRADDYRNQVTALGERFSAMCAMQGDLMRQLEEARGE